MTIQDEAAPYYSRYISLVPNDDILQTLVKQLDDTISFLSTISEEQSLQSYAPGKWTMRQLLNHINDTERAFVFRAVWFARGFDAPLPGYDQDIAVNGAQANDVSWANHIEEFRRIRLATLSFFQNLPAEAWLRSGIASDNPFTVRALAYITAGHLLHHEAILRERYL